MCNERERGEGDTAGEAVRGARGVGHGVRGVTPGTPTRPEESGGLGVSAATRCGRVRVGAVEGACAVWVGVAGRARALREAFDAKAGAAPAERFGLVRPAVAGVVVGGRLGPRRGGVRRLGGCPAAGPGAAPSSEA
jgi:hypothetical protein